MTALDIPEPTGPLSEAESFALRRYEQEIDKGIKTFVIVGRALARIRDGRLYRASHDTFEAYCAERWQLSRPRAYELMSAAGLTDGLSAIADTPVPVNEGQARELSGLDAPTAAEVMQAAAESGPVTAKAIREAREQIAPKPKPAPKAKVTHRETVTDITEVDPDTGEIVDGGIAEAAGRAAGDVAVLPTPPREPTIADAIREAKSRPFIVADKAIDRWRQAYKTSDAIGGIAAVLADADTDPFVGMPASWDLWLADLDRTIAVATEWAAAIRRRNLRSVK